MRVVQKWELTPAALGGLLARLDSDATAAGERYEHLRRALVKFFSWHGTPDPDSSADETLDRIARRLNAGHTIDDVSAFAYGVARLIRLERQRQAAAMPTSSDEGLIERTAAVPHEGDEVRDHCLQRCLQELDGTDRELIVSYYVGAGRERVQARGRIAATLGVSDNALRHRAQRLRDRLRICATSCIERAEASMA